MASEAGSVLVYGGRGALGSVIVKYFKAKQFWVGSIDLATNEDADTNVLVKPGDVWTEQGETVMKDVENILGDRKLDAVLCVAGGWAGGNAASKDLIKNADLMWKQSVWSSVLSSSIASKYLKETGVLSLPGAQPCLNGTPGMVGYGMAKAAIHQLVKSLAAKDSGMPAGSLSVAILPVTLDTPMNRKWMSNADFSTWTPLEYIAELFHKWTRNVERPVSGSLVQIITKGGDTELVIT